MNSLRVAERQTTLLDVLDRLLETGVVVAGDLTLTVANVDLIFASLRLVLTSVDKAREVRGRDDQGGSAPEGPGEGSPLADPPGYPGWGQNASVATDLVGVAEKPEGQHFPPPSFLLSGEAEKGRSGDFEPGNIISSTSAGGVPAREPADCVIDPDKLANGLSQLVLTVVELLRKLLEREVLRRMERGTLTPVEMERLGEAFSKLEQKMQELKTVFHFRDEDLNLDLGPLGKLL